MGQPRPTRLGRAGVIFERVESRVLCSTAGIVELGPRHLTARDLIAGDRYVYFQGVTEEHGAELWRTDVTPAGTALVRDIAPGRGSSHVRMLATVNDKVFFAAYEGSGSSEVASIWTSDGTAEGTVLVKRGIAPSAFLGTSFAFNGQAFFSARNTGARNPGLWRSDGTAKGTYLVSRLGNSDVHTIPNVASGWVSFNGVLTFMVTGRGRVVWRSDGTKAETYPLGIPSNEADGVYGAVPFKRKLYLAIHDALWRTDATRGSSTRVRAIENGGIRGFTEAGGSLFFIANDGARRQVLWQLDGTAAGTRAVREIPQDLTNLRIFGTLRGSLILGASHEPDGSTLWRYDPAASRATALGEIDAGGFNVVTIGDLLISRGWQTDGTPEGTRAIPELSSYTLTRMRHAVYSPEDGLTQYTPPGMLSGVVYDDVNGSGRIDTGDARQSGVRVFVDANRNDRFDRNEQSVRTNARGEYHLGDLEPGRHRIGVTAVEGFAATTPAPLEVLIEGPGRVARAHFGRERIR